MSLDIFTDLNSVQKEAVQTLEGPLLILAGAGTGKTKVLTSRIVNILNQGLARPSEILAVTFTNKASKEMKERVEALLGYPVDGFWIGTFHSIGLRILRRHYIEAGLRPNFSILDMDDCEKIIKQILLESNVDTKKFPASMVMNTIGRLKDKNILPDTLPNVDNKMIGSTSLGEVYTSYQRRLKELNAVDFGDLLLLCVDLFRQFPDILEQWQTRFKYIMVDEYQDTNSLQYLFVRVLALKYSNICAVGDDDQSIYSWRGAEIANILRFEEDFVGAKILRLEQNYRSTTPILKIASSIISKNSDRWDKNLWTDREGENKVKLYEAFNSKQEADFLATTINDLVRSGLKYNQIAVLIRATFQSREIEERLMFHAIPYRFIGGSRFYDRLEIKDIIAYLRLLYQSYDDMAFLRIVNVPKRGIGASSLDKLQQFARDRGMSLYSASKEAIGKSIIPKKAENELSSFIENFEIWKYAVDGQSLGGIAKVIVEESGYMDMWEAENSAESKARIENIKELFMALESFETLEEFLEHVSLVSDKEEENEDNKITIMTLHGAKGLEFDTVFLPGWEEGILPNQRSIDDLGDMGLEEERRLAYVGITRAKKDLYISFSKNRQMYGNWQACIGSRFIDEMNFDFVERLSSQESASQRTMRDSYTNKAFYGDKSDSFPFKKFNEDDFVSTKKEFKGIKVGMRVNHSTMGEGEVISVQGPIATVNFDDGSSKKIMVSFLKEIKQ